MDQPVFFALLLSGAAGLSTLIGAAAVFFLKGKNEKAITLSLGFAAGVISCVSLAELYPQGRQMLALSMGASAGTLIAAGAFLVGLLISAFMDRLVPRNELVLTSGEGGRPDLFHLGIVSALAIGLHNLPEGLVTFMSGYEDASLGISMAIAIALHNIPEGLLIAMPVYYATGSRKKAVIYCLFSGIAEPIGALIAFFALRPLITPLTMGAIFAFLAGVMVYISIGELIPASRQYGRSREALVSTFAGIFIMLLTQMF